jgi:hypothetical protein
LPGARRNWRNADFEQPYQRTLTTEPAQTPLSSSNIGLHTNTVSTQEIVGSLENRNELPVVHVAFRDICREKAVVMSETRVYMVVPAFQAGFEKEQTSRPNFSGSLLWTRYRACQ